VKDMLKRFVIISIAAFSMGLAAGDRVIEPIEQPRQNPQTIGFAEGSTQYVGSGKLRFLRFDTPMYTVVGDSGTQIRLVYISPNGPAKALRLTPIASDSSVLINLTDTRAYPQQNRPDSTPVYSSELFVNPSDFGPNPGENVAYRAVLIGQNGQEGEAIVTGLNFRSLRDFQEDPRIKLNRERAQEALEDVIAVNFYRALGESSLSIYSLESYRTYSRARIALRLPATYDLQWNTQLIQRALESGKVTGRDDLGNTYLFALGNDIRVIPGITGLEFSLIMTPRLSSQAKRGTIKVGPIPDREENGFKIVIDEPFKSGFEIPLELKR
jgi:hypothetical protein